MEGTELRDYIYCWILIGISEVFVLMMLYYLVIKKDKKMAIFLAVVVLVPTVIALWIAMQYVAAHYSWSFI